MKNRTAQQNVALIKQDICPKCLGELRENGGFETSWGETSEFYFCTRCEAEFTLTNKKENAEQTDDCVVKKDPESFKL